MHPSVVANVLAPVMLILWIPITLALFMKIRNPALAATISIVGTGLLLPSGYAFDFQGLPPLDRESIAVLSCLLAMLLSRKNMLAARKPGNGAEVLALVMIVGSFGTVLTNGEARDLGVRTLPGLRLWDVADMSARAVFMYGIPYYLGRILFRRPQQLRTLMWVLAVAGVLYSLPIFWEARMSPGLHYFIYGYYPAGFVQAYRELFFGWRPMVLVGHGLALSMFVLTTALSAAALYRASPRREALRLGLLVAFLTLLVIVCNSFGTIVYALSLVPLLCFAPPPWLRRTLMGATVLVFLYPALRSADIFPSQTLVNAAATYSVNRAESLQYRFDNEDILLSQARDKLLFGWGGYGRNRVYDERDGRDVSTTDGYWIIVLGVSGLVGFLSIFSMMLLPVVGAIRATARRPAKGKGQGASDVYLVLGLALIIAICAIDLLPNGAPSVRTVFFAGALGGALRGWPRSRGKRPRERRDPVQPPPNDPPPSDDGSPSAPPSGPSGSSLAGSLLESRRGD